MSGALAANSESYLNKPSCPLIQGPFRHYVLNVLWIFINVLCVFLTMYHLYKLYKDLSRSNLEAVRVASLVTTMISVNQSPSSLPGDTLIGLPAPQAQAASDTTASHQLLPNNVNNGGQQRNGRAHTEQQPAPPTSTALNPPSLPPLTESARIKARFFSTSLAYTK